MSRTLTFTGNTSVLTSHFTDPIHLGDGGWVCGLISFEGYNTITNIDETNNRLYLLGKDITFSLEGLSNTSTLINRIKSLLPNGFTLNVTFNKGFVIIQSNKTFFNDIEDTLLTDFGFNKGRVLEANVEHRADNPFKHRIGKRKLIWGETIELAPGSYQLSDISREFKKHNVDLSERLVLRACTIKSPDRINFVSKNNIGGILGFERKILPANLIHKSKYDINIFKENDIYIRCSIVSGAFVNGCSTHVLHHFSCKVPPGNKISEVPKNVIYLNLLTPTLKTVTIRLTDQDGKLLNFSGETITVRIHIKRDD